MNDQNGNISLCLYCTSSCVIESVTCGAPIPSGLIV